MPKTRIQIKDRDGLGSITAYVMWFHNALMQQRQIAYDGQRWFVQPKNNVPFAPVGESEVPTDVKTEMIRLIKSQSPELSIENDLILELVGAIEIARKRFSDLNGQVTSEVWDANYPAVHALDEALASYKAKWRFLKEQS